ncbi:MAG: aminopeptidase [Deltaproteobacteria bacterium]|nr:aminopeptidase [Deltaproteobacteria bacterium]
MHSIITRQELETWADFLLDHSLAGVGDDDVVMIKGEHICWPLISVLEEKVIAAGAIADVFIVPPNNDRGRVWSAAMGKHGSPEQIKRVPLWCTSRYKMMTKYIEVLGAEDPDLYTGLEPDQVRRLAAADQPISTIRLAKPWVLTLFPTKGFARTEGMEFEEYARFIVRASTTDPRLLKAAEERLAPKFDAAKTITIETEHPKEKRLLSLKMNLEQSIATMSYGLRNFPDGEVFTSPDARKVEGEIYLDLPVHYGGHDIQGIYLRLEGGRIAEYHAELGHEHLAAIIETDLGSHRIGEVALGMNPGLDRVLKHPLFVEKVGGTLHIAIGASYESCYVSDPSTPEGKARIAELEKRKVLNRSAQHVDIVTDFRPGGVGRRVLLDGEALEVREGLWVASS